MHIIFLRAVIFPYGGPACIILYMRISSAELMTVLYTQTAGRIVMTLCLTVYAAAAIWGRSMTRKAMTAA